MVQVPRTRHKTESFHRTPGVPIRLGFHQLLSRQPTKIKSEWRYEPVTQNDDVVKFFKPLAFSTQLPRLSSAILTSSG